MTASHAGITVTWDHRRRAVRRVESVKSVNTARRRTSDIEVALRSPEEREEASSYVRPYLGRPPVVRRSLIQRLAVVVVMVVFLGRRKSAASVFVKDEFDTDWGADSADSVEMFAAF